MDISSLSAYTDYVTDSAKSNSNIDSSNLSKTDYSNASDEELMQVCKEFEAYFVEQVYKEMWKTVPESESSSASTSTMVDYFKDEMIKDLSEETTDQNSIGLAQTLYEQMKRNYNLD